MQYVLSILAGKGGGSRVSAVDSEGGGELICMKHYLSIYPGGLTQGL